MAPNDFVGINRFSMYADFYVESQVLLLYVLTQFHMWFLIVHIV